jgi:GGDEF domain-containing protein
MWQEDIEALNKFLSVLGWLLAVAARYPQHFQFGLAHIDYRNLERIGEAYGAKDGSIKLDKVAHSLRQAFRQTDLVARNAGDFWILLPHVAAVETVSGKIRYILDTCTEDGLKIVERDISFFVVDQALAKLNADSGFTPLEFLSYLKDNQHRLARYESAVQATQ